MRQGRMAGGEGPRTDDEGWLGPDQAGRPFRAQIWERRRWLLAVLTLAILLAGSFVFVLPKSVHPASLSSPIGAPVAYVHMADVQTGWAQVVDDLFRTTDGGRHWSRVTPPGQPILAQAAPAAFLNGTVAWVAQLGYSGSIGSETFVILRTQDGGRHWVPGMPVTVTTPAVLLDLYFLDLQHGWMLFSQSDVDTSHLGEIALYQTADGGAHWSLVLNGPGGAPNLGLCSLPILTFVSPEHGWMTADCTTDVAALWETTDGGQTWNVGALPGASHCGCWQPPVILPDRNGVLPAKIGNWMYVTGDGGETWSARQLPTDAAIVSDFIDADNGWVALQTTSALYRTTNGGRQWTALSSDLRLNKLWELDFIDTRNGWALGQAIEGSPGILYKTADGGVHWVKVRV